MHDDDHVTQYGKGCLDIESLLSQSAVNSLGPLSSLCVVCRTTCTLVLVQGRVEIHASSLANEVGIVCRRANRDCLSRSVKVEANFMDKGLQGILAEVQLIFQDDIVSRSGGALQALVRLKEEIP